MQLTREQIAKAKSGQPVDVADNGDEFVLIRRDVYDRLKQPPYDAGEWTEEEMMHLAAEAADDLDRMDENDYSTTLK